VAFRLFVDGTDRIDRIPVESIEVIEAGPGNVSSMRFTMEPNPGSLDRLQVVSLDTGTTANRLFYGYITNLRYLVYGAGNLRVEVTCAGVEILLDWLVHSGVTILAATNFQNAVNQIVAAKSGAIGVGMSTARTGDVTNTIGDFVRPDLGTTPFLTGGVNWVVPQGTLRQRIEQLHLKSSFFNGVGFEGFGLNLTIDWQINLRAWENEAALMPSDWTKLEIENDPSPSGGTFVGENFEVAYDYAAVPDRVYVIGTGVAGFVGATTFPRIENVLNAPEILTANERDMAGENYLDAREAPDRWEFDITDFTPPSTTIHAGGLCDIVDSSGGTTSDHRIAEIRKTFHGTGRQDWHVTLGRPSASMTRAVVARGVGVR